MESLKISVELPFGGEYLLNVNDTARIRSIGYFIQLKATRIYLYFASVVPHLSRRAQISKTIEIDREKKNKKSIDFRILLFPISCQIYVSRKVKAIEITAKGVNNPCIDWAM